VDDQDLEEKVDKETVKILSYYKLI
jgi:hypothetical protein